MRTEVIRRHIRTSYQNKGLTHLINKKLIHPNYKKSGPKIMVNLYLHELGNLWTVSALKEYVIIFIRLKISVKSQHGEF